MVGSEAPAVERLTAADLADCLALSAEAGWNQVSADWRLFFEHGIVWGVRRDGVVATAALLPYPPATAWISMVLTARRARRQGFATVLMRTAIEAAAARGLAPQLDATPDGEPVYKRLGFRPLFPLTRWRRAGPRTAGGGRAAAAGDGEAAGAGSACSERANGAAGGNGTPGAKPPDSGSFDPAAAIARDAAAFGVHRAAVIGALAARGPAVLTDRALALCRDGHTARHAGPIVAEDADSGLLALDAVLARLPADTGVIVDATDAGGLAEALAARGFAVERPFLRMAMGTPPAADPRRYLAAAGPELG